MKIQDGFVLQPDGDGYRVLFPEGHPDAGGALELNTTGAMLWQELCLGTDMYGLTALLRNTFDVEEAEASGAVARFVAQLKEVACLDE